MKNLNNAIILLIINMLFASCFKTDIDKISDEIIWNPNISIAAGTIFSQLDTTQTDTINIGEIVTFEVSDTLFFNFTNMSDGKEQFFKSMMFRIKMTNEFPVVCEFLMYYNDTVLLYPNPITIPAGTIDSSGVCTKPSIKSEDIMIKDNQTIKDIINIKHFLIKATIKNVNITPAIQKNLNNYRFKAQLGTQMEIYVDE
jgi:hypothetical protein